MPHALLTIGAATPRRCANPGAFRDSAARRGGASATPVHDTGIMMRRPRTLSVLAVVVSLVGCKRGDGPASVPPGRDAGARDAS
ncbi:MAG: hypothetical protein K8W52_01820, partial [Deltaproteobacteria bacterium]|nr:hypothetical protein [Deltaproteobacteria bacterium]